MYVEEVCIDGFKSYAQRTVVPAFDPLFNAITGLNGSGKSNILDAICFVLGITNLSQVRLGLSDENAPKRTKTVLFPFPKIRVFSRLRDRSRRSFFCLVIFFFLLTSSPTPNPKHRFVRVARASHAVPVYRTSTTTTTLGSRVLSAGARVQARPGGRDESLSLHRVQQLGSRSFARRVRALRPNHGDAPDRHRRKEQVHD
jgi:hypothetical protein